MHNILSAIDFSCLVVLVRQLRVTVLHNTTITGMQSLKYNRSRLKGICPDTLGRCVMGVRIVLYQYDGHQGRIFDIDPTSHHSSSLVPRHILKQGHKRHGSPGQRFLW